MGQGDTERSILALIQLAFGCALLAAGWAVFYTPKGWIRWHWEALGSGKPAVAYECLDNWRGAFNDPEAVYLYDGFTLPTFHEVDVEVRGKNKMGAWVKGTVACALKDDGSLDGAATTGLRFMKMSRPDDGEVPP